MNIEDLPQVVKPYAAQWEFITNIENSNFNIVILNFNVKHIYHYCWALITNIEFRYIYYCFKFIIKKH